MNPTTTPKQATDPSDAAGSRTGARHPRGFAPARFPALAMSALMASLVLASMTVATTAGPDSGGYRLIDSLESGGPAYDFDDISSTGTSAGVECDDCVSAAIPLGFTFRFYEVDYTEVYVSSNGFLSFDPAADHGCCSGQAMPTAGGGPSNLVAAYWTDLNPAVGGSVEYQAFSGVFIVQWTDVVFYATSTLAVKAQAKLFDDGSIEVHYASAASSSSATAGIESLAGGAGLTYQDGFPSASALAVQYACGPCYAVPVPPTPVMAYGHIWIRDTGTGVTATTDYDTAFWACSFVINSLPPTVNCVPTGPPPGQNTYWDCPAMILSAQSLGPTGAVRGQVDCNPGTGAAALVTADLQGAGATDTLSGPLGAVTTIRCQAFGYGGTAAPVAPYQVECYEPGAGAPKLPAVSPPSTEPIAKLLQ